MGNMLSCVVHGQKKMFYSCIMFWGSGWSKTTPMMSNAVCCHCALLSTFWAWKGECVPGNGEYQSSEFGHQLCFLTEGTSDFNSRCKQISRMWVWHTDTDMCTLTKHCFWLTTMTSHEVLCCYYFYSNAALTNLQPSGFFLYLHSHILPILQRFHHFWEMHWFLRNYLPSAGEWGPFPWPAEISSKARTFRQKKYFQGEQLKAPNKSSHVLSPRTDQPLLERPSADWCKEASFFDVHSSSYHGFGGNKRQWGLGRGSQYLNWIPEFANWNLTKTRGEFKREVEWQRTASGHWMPRPPLRTKYLWWMWCWDFCVVPWDKTPLYATASVVSMMDASQKAVHSPRFVAFLGATIHTGKRRKKERNHRSSLLEYTLFSRHTYKTNTSCQYHRYFSGKNITTQPFLCIYTLHFSCKNVTNWDSSRTALVLRRSLALSSAACPGCDKN